MRRLSNGHPPILKWSKVCLRSKVLRAHHDTPTYSLIVCVQKSNSMLTSTKVFIKNSLKEAYASLRVSMAWGFSQTFFREMLDEQALGYASLDGFLIDFWEGWVMKRDANNIVSHLWTGQKVDISVNETYQGDLDKALACIQADMIIMLPSSDLYFPVEGASREASQIPNAGLRVLNTVWDHVAGEEMNDADTAVIKHAINELLRR